MRSVHIPKIIKNIPQGIFKGCISLKKCYIPDDVTASEIFILNGVIDTGEDGFGNCPNLLVRCEGESFTYNYLQK